MKIAVVLLIALLCTSIMAAKKEKQPQEEDPNMFQSELFTELDDTNFQDFISSNKLVLVKFYAPWCDYCKQVWPKLLEVVKEYSKSNPELKFVKVQADGNEAQKTAKSEKIQGFPTIKFYYQGIAKTYEGQPSKDKLRAWILRAMQDPSKEIKEQKELQTYLKRYKDEVVFMFFSKEDQESEEYKTFVKFARNQDEAKVVHTFSPELKAAYNITKDYDAVIFTSFEDKVFYLNNDVTLKNLKRFLMYNKNPFMISVTSTHFEAAQDTGKYILYLFLSGDKKNDVSNNLFTSVKAAANKMKYDGNIQHILFFDKYSKLALERADEVSIDPKTSSLPAVVIIHTTRKNIHKYVMPLTGAELTVENIKQFTAEVKAGKVQEWFKSEEIPTEQTSPVKYLVQKTFDETINDETKDVLVMIQAPWCSACKKMKPKFEKVAQAVANNPHILLAQIDGTKNDILDGDIEEYPTIYLFPQGKKHKPINCLEQDVKGFLKFLQKKTTFEWVEPLVIEEEKVQQKKIDL